MKEYDSRIGCPPFVRAPFFVDSNPNGIVEGAKGDVALNYNNGSIYVCVEDGTEWHLLECSNGSLSLEHVDEKLPEKIETKQECKHEYIQLFTSLSCKYCGKQKE